MQYAKKAGYHMETKYTMGIRRKVGDPVSEIPAPQNFSELLNLTVISL